jgi:hypothetical protein
MQSTSEMLYGTYSSEQKESSRLFSIEVGHDLLHNLCSLNPGPIYIQLEIERCVCMHDCDENKNGNNC